MRTLHEGARGCGYRKPGALYLCSDAVGQECPLLPVLMDVCPCCGAGIRPARGWTWVDPDRLLPHHRSADGGKHPACPLNGYGLMGERAGLLWIGAVHYPTPADWMAEGVRMGFSRRIRVVPKGFEVGQWVLVGHKDAVVTGYEALAPEQLLKSDQPRVYDTLADAWAAGATHTARCTAPGIFHLWRPQRIEYVVVGGETADELAAFEARGIETVRVVPVQAELREANDTSTNDG